MEKHIDKDKESDQIFTLIRDFNINMQLSMIRPTNDDSIK
jgi:hypothetical protein